MEVTQPRSERPQPNIEAGSSLIQMHSMHSYFWHVQAVRKPRVFCTQCSR